MSFNYADEYDAYWSSKDRIGEQSFADADAVAHEILLSCGGGNILDIGSGMGHLVRALLRVGVDATGVDVSQVAVDHANAFAPGRFRHASVLELPFDAGTFDTVISTDCLEHLSEEDVVKALREIRRVVRRSLFFRLATTPDRDGHWHLTVQPRRWWEQRFFEAGFRKHPSYYQINNYEALENDGWQISVLLERIPDDALAAYPLVALAAERDLHMDMLRESGSRSDAHVARYQWAMQYIRPGDTVLDAACGLGYGSHVLQLSSTAARTIGIDGSEYAIDYARRNFGADNPRLEFRCGLLPQALADMPDGSVDAIVSFETLEHVQDNAALLVEFHRVLSPGGRLLVSVPNDWSDETGEDPNPFHLHVYTLARLRDELGRLFTVEALTAQTANQCKSGPGRKAWRRAGRAMVPFSLQAADTDEPEAEWWLAVAMRSPLETAGIEYRETSYPQFAHPAWHVTRFAENYRNPWLVRSLVDIGHRLTDPVELQALAIQVSDAEDSGYVDKGAALCVLAYQMLTGDHARAEHIADLAARVAAYVRVQCSSPHGIRWRISLLFALGKLWMATGDFKRARTAFEDCVAIDATLFSPLLCNRTVEARLLLGVLAIACDDRDAARSHWQAGIAEAQRAVGTDWHASLGDLLRPAEFGLPELASVLEHASACAYALVNLPDIDSKYWWQLHLYRDRPSQARIAARQLAEARERNHMLTAGLETRQRELDLQGGYIVEFQAQVAAKQGELDLQGQHIAGLKDELERYRQTTAALVEAHRVEVGHLKYRISELEKITEWIPKWLRNRITSR